MSSKLGLLFSSVTTVVPLFVNPLAWVGAVAGALVGWGVCWLVFVIPFQKNLASREAQLDHWSQLNQQLQEQTADNRNMSQSELKQFIASNQEASAAFAEIQRRLQQRELRLSETPISFILIPIAVLALGFGGVVLVFRAINQKAKETVELVLQLAPHEIFHAVGARHAVLSGSSNRNDLTLPPSSADFAQRSLPLSHGRPE